MAAEHRAPTNATIKQLYGTALRCAAPGCTEPLYRPGLDGQSRVLNSQVCHIAARSLGGPRWDPDMSQEANAGYDNLLLLCFSHHDEVDQPSLTAQYPAALLKNWKHEQIELSNRIGEHWNLADSEVEKVRTASFEIRVDEQTVHIGGTGGSAIGAGGGGGGALGPGAIGGRGGDGGHLSLDGSDGAAPGAGGGGGGWIAPDSRPWPAGAAPLGHLGTAHVPGFDGLPGGESTFGNPGDSFFVRASGGQGALAGSGVRSRSSLVRSSSVMLVRAVETSSALSYVLGGNWSTITLLNVPSPLTLLLLLVLEAGGAPVGEYTIEVQARGPSGATQLLAAFPLSITEAGDIVRCPVPMSVQPAIDAFGLWTLAISSDVALLVEHSFLVQRQGSTETTPT